MDYRLLPRSQWIRVEEALSSFGQSLPTHSESLIAVAEDFGVIAGIHCLQPQLHGEPVWIHPEYRGKVNFLRMKDCLTDALPPSCPFYVFAPNRTISFMAGQAAMKKLPWEIWKGEA